MNIFKIFALSFILLLACGFVLAQEEITTEEVASEIAEAIALDEDITAEDLGVSEPNLLPDSPFYFFKNWGREVQSFFTFNSIKKAELREKFANEKLLEMKKVIEKKERTREQVEKAIRNYENEIAVTKRAAEKIQERAEENEQVGKFLDKFIQQQVLHQRVLGKLENQVPSESFEKIKEAREKHVEKFGEVMAKLEENKENIQERLENNLQKVKGSEFKEFKNLEVLKSLEEKVPEAAKEAIQNVRANTLIRLKEKVEVLPTAKVEQFQAYTEGITGTKEKQMEILESLREGLKEKPAIQEKLNQTRIKVIERVQAEVQTIKKACQEISKPAADFCQDGRIVVKKDEQGCITSFSCVIPAEIEALPKPTTESPKACITLWDPVCGKDGKTYSNTCYAGLANVEVDYKGKCQEAECKIDSDCPQPRCGPAGTISARCIGANARCVAGKCQIISQAQQQGSPVK